MRGAWRHALGLLTAALFLGVGLSAWGGGRPVVGATLSALGVFRAVAWAWDLAQALRSAGEEGTDPGEPG